jgi:hypothetical protein
MPDPIFLILSLSKDAGCYCSGSTSPAFSRRHEIE